MKFLPRTVLKMMGKSIAKKENKTPQDIEMEKIFAGSFDHTDKSNVEDMVSHLK